MPPKQGEALLQVGQTVLQFCGRDGHRRLKSFAVIVSMSSSHGNWGAASDAAAGPPCDLLHTGDSH
jgi:hypothetical protein